MYNLFEYVKWRGDLTFDQSEINEVDFAVFSQIVMIPYSLCFEMPIPSKKKGITIEELSQKVELNKNYLTQNIGLIIPHQLIELIIRLGKCNRYKNLIIKNYINDICINKEIQFTALTIDIDDDTIVAVFSGTDDTIAGWKENFNMMFTFPTGAQEKSVKYLEYINNNKKIYLSGHSKGGNLVMYSIAHCSNKTFKNIVNGYCFDAPGLSEDNLDSNIVNERSKKILEYTPQTAIIGRFFNHFNNDIVVNSYNNGLFQHDLLSWEVDTNKFKRLVERDNDSKYIELKINSILKDLTPIMREEFVEVGYGLFVRARVETLTDAMSSKSSIVKNYLNINKEERKILDSTLYKLFKDKIVLKNIYYVFVDSLGKSKEKKKLIKQIKKQQL